MTDYKDKYITLLEMNIRLLEDKLKRVTEDLQEFPTTRTGLYEPPEWVGPWPTSPSETVICPSVYTTGSDLASSSTLYPTGSDDPIL